MFTYGGYGFSTVDCVIDTLVGAQLGLHGNPLTRPYVVETTKSRSVNIWEIIEWRRFTLPKHTLYL